MINFFLYNWQVRDEWFQWCQQLSIEELLKRRTGGAGSILYTLFHIIDVEYSWIRGIQRKEDRIFSFEDYKTLEKIEMLSTKLRNELLEFLTSHKEFNDEVVTVAWDENEYTKNDILHHVIVHEIHHMGQLSVWAREIALHPVPANYIGRDFKSYFKG